MTKEEALFCYPQGESEPYGHVPVNRIYEAMDRWAKQEAIAYAHWCFRKMFPFHLTDEPGEEAQTLYNQFKNQQ